MPALDIAARSVLESQAVHGTVASLVEDRALDYHFQGLFQYAAIRVGRKRAIEVLQQLEYELADVLSQAREQPVSPQAKLYRRIRQLVGSGSVEALLPEATEWWRPSDPNYRAGLVTLRHALAGEHGEIAELRFARRLRSSDVAHALSIEPDAVEQSAAAVRALALRLLGRRPPSRDGTLEGALLEAFALDPRRVQLPQRRGRKPMLAEGSLIAGRYEVEKLLGTGAFADVYRARDRDVTGHVVALKILRRRASDQSSIDSSLRELQLIASVFHPSVVQLKDHGWHEGHLWFVMPLYRGETLATRLRRGPLTRRDAREIFEPLAEALATMHRAGVRHQDIKPANVFLANLELDGQGPSAPGRILPVLLDLGVAAKDAELVLAGTPAYFAPEVAARFAGVPDPPPVGPKADVFSLALTLCHALDPDLREHVAGGAVDAFVTFRASHAPSGPARRDLRDLKLAFARWLHFSPDERPNAEEFHRELSALTRRQELAARRWSLLRWALPTLVAIAALFGAVVFVLSREAALQRREADHARARAMQARKQAESLYASFTTEEARRRELEADVKRLEQDYQASRMTREQLASRLAQSEGQLAVLSEREKTLQQRLRQALEELHAVRTEREQLRSEQEAHVAEKSSLEHALQQQQERGSELEAEVERLRAQLAQNKANLAQAHARMDELEVKLSAVRQLFPPPPARRPNTLKAGPEL